MAGQRVGCPADLLLFFGFSLLFVRSTGGDHLAIGDLDQTDRTVIFHVELAVCGELGDTFGSGEHVAMLGVAAARFQA